MTLGSHRIPAGLMLPVIIAAAHDQSLLGPNDLRADGEAVVDKTVRNCRGVQGAVPDVSDVAFEQAPGSCPVCLVVVTDLSASGRSVHSQAMTPSRIVIDPVAVSYTHLRAHETR